MRDVMNELTVSVMDARFGCRGPIKGTFLMLGLPNQEIREMASGRKAISVRCHWQSSDDPDDYLDFVVFDDDVTVNTDYTGPVVWRIGRSDRVI